MHCEEEKSQNYEGDTLGSVIEMYFKNIYNQRFPFVNSKQLVGKCWAPTPPPLPWLVILFGQLKEGFLQRFQEFLMM